MKPVTNSGAESIPYPTLETVPVNNSDLNKSILNPIANSKRDNIEVNWKAMSEQKTEGTSSVLS